MFQLGKDGGLPRVTAHVRSLRICAGEHSFFFVSTPPLALGPSMQNKPQ